MDQGKANRFLSERMGWCWHEWQVGEDGKNHCIHCGISSRDPFSMDFFTPEGFFELWNWARKEEWWVRCKQDFAITEWTRVGKDNFQTFGEFAETLIDPVLFPAAVARYLGYREPESP